MPAGRRVSRSDGRVDAADPGGGEAGATYRYLGSGVGLGALMLVRALLHRAPQDEAVSLRIPLHELPFL